MILALLLLISSILCHAEDIPLDVTNPVKEDETFFVSTFLRNVEISSFYFTIVYHWQGDIMYRYKTKISLSMPVAGYTHHQMEGWARQAYSNAWDRRTSIPLEIPILVPNLPCHPVKKKQQSEEVYIINPNRQN